MQLVRRKCEVQLSRYKSAVATAQRWNEKKKMFEWRERIYMNNNKTRSVEQVFAW